MLMLDVSGRTDLDGLVELSESVILIRFGLCIGLLGFLKLTK